jgi:LysM repeat protein
VRAGDTLSAIARRTGRTIGQLLAANPAITNPNLLRVGQVLVIPPPNAPDMGTTSAGVADAVEDVTDADGEPVAGQGYVDITGFGARLEADTLRIGLDFVAMPPRRADPGVEALTYTVVIDTDGDADPDHRLTWSNAVPGTTGFVLTLEDRETGRTVSGDDVPGTAAIEDGGLTILLDRDAVGRSRQVALAASAGREFRAGGPGDQEVDLTVDFAPNQQWPRRNPRWVEIGRP